MNGELEIIEAGPALSIQDHGRPGYGRYGLSPGGAMDRFALAEGAALLDQPGSLAAIEMAGAGGRFKAAGSTLDMALTGAVMKASLDGRPLRWRRTFRLEPGQVLEVGSAIRGTYGYLHVAGGIEVAPVIGSKSTHLRAGLGGLNGRPLEPGDRLPTGATGDGRFTARRLPEPAYLRRNEIRVVWGPQSPRFSDESRQRLLSESFRVSHRRDRMAMRLDFDQDRPAFEALLTGLSDPTVAGDIQMTGDGVPTVLLVERQTTGGYPRIATVIDADFEALAQRTAGSAVRFALVDHDAAVEALFERRRAIRELPDRVEPVVREPGDIDELLAYNLISGVVAAGDNADDADD